MTDFRRHTPPSKTRSGGLRSIKKSSKSKTTLSKQEQQEHAALLKAVRQDRARALEAAAKSRLAEHCATVAVPLRGNLALGQFSISQILLLEFVLALRQHMSEEMLLKPQSTINSAALQASPAGYIRNSIGYETIGQHS